MTTDASLIALLALVYLTSLFGLAYLSDRNILPVSVTRSPVLHALAQGTFISAWGYYGIFSLAQTHGYGALAYYLGTGALLLFAPFILIPMTRIANQFQLNSFADLLAFRFPTASLGKWVTVVLLLSAMPLMALQIKAVVEAWHIVITPNSTDIGFSPLFAVLFVATVCSFAVIFGTGRINQNGLVVTLAAESVLKLAGIVILGGVATFSVFNGLGDLDQWLVAHPEQMNIVYQVLGQDNSPWLVLIFLSGSLLMPHAFNYNNGRKLQIRSLRIGSWLIPLYLMLMALPLFPIIWAAESLDAPYIGTDYIALGVALALENPVLLTIIVLGGLSAATGTMVLMLLTLSTMTLNHLILPRTGLPSEMSLYKWLAKWQRIAVIALAILALLSALVMSDASLTALAFTAFMGTLQLIPALIGLVLWPEARGRAIAYGIYVGAALWALTMLIPTFIGMSSFSFEVFNLSLSLGSDHWQNALALSFGANLVVLAVVHVSSSQHEQERESALLCGLNDESVPSMMRLVALTPQAMIEGLTPALGKQVALSEIRRAMKQLGLDLNERRPSELMKVRNQVQANLSGLMGVATARELVGDCLPIRDNETKAVDLVQLEQRISTKRSTLPGIAAELDRLRRHHRSTLEQLPIGVATFTEEYELMLWNSSLSDLTSISAKTASGTNIADLDKPWGTLLNDFVRSGNNYQRASIIVNGVTRSLDLYKARRSQQFQATDGRILMVEDRTEIEQLQAQLRHKERLSSVGRLAAGVAHEIGNPITGIACLAQELADTGNDPSIREAAQQIEEQTRRVTTIVNTLINFSHPGSGEVKKSSLALHPLVNDAAKLLTLREDRTNVSFINEVAEDLIIEADSTQILQVLLNLMGNARDASNEKQSVWVRAKQKTNWLLVEIEDEGTGIAKEHINELFDPFFTTKDVGEGTGLGLSIVYHIVREHGGNIDVISPVPNKDHGTKFVITFPKVND